MTESEYKQRLWAGAIALAFILVASLGATLKINTPPRAVGADAPDSEFSAARAMALIEEFAQKPHPLGSVENERVMHVLAEALEELGYEAHIQGEPILRGHTYSRARNVWARLPGTDSTGAVVLCAHYDSVPYGPGAADDGSGVAAIVETARVLKNSEPLRNDIIFLLTDGEESGLLGPRTFLEHNPHREDLKLVLNFEARGHYGSSMMYLTWPGNEATMRNFIEGASHPVTSSVMFDFADALPTSSDYYVFKAEGYPGFDLAFVGGLKYYHTPNDSPEKLSMRSLQHHGTYGVSIAKQFGNIDLGTLLDDPDERVVYFNTLGHHMVMYSAKWVWPITLLALFIAIVALALGVARKRIGVGGLLGGALVWLAALIAAPLLSILPVAYGVSRFGPYALYNQHWYILGYIGLLFAVFGLVYAVAARIQRPESLAAGAMLLLLPVLVGATWLLPMGSFALAWPVMGVALGLLVLFLLPESPWIRLLAAIAGSAPALVLMPPFVYTLIETFTFLMGPAVLPFAGMILGLAVLPLAIVGKAPKIGFGMPAVAAVLALIAFGIAAFDTRFTPDRPKMNYLLYAANHTDGTAIYATRDRQLDEWTGQFFGNGDEWGDLHEFAPFDRNEFRIAEAPVVDTDLGTIEVVEDVTEDGVRRVTLFIQTGHETAQFYIWTSPDASVRGVTVDGKAWDSSDRLPVAKWYGHLRGRFDEGVTLAFELDADGEPFELTMVEETYGVPAVEGIRPRPNWMIPMSNTMPTDWDFSLNKILSGDLLGVLRFEPGSRSMHLYSRQDFAFEAAAVDDILQEVEEEIEEGEVEAI